MPKFEKTSCSQCGGEFGPGDHGFSHCFSHRAKNDPLISAARLALNFIENTESELGIKLGSGDALRAALSPSGMPIESNINKCPSCSRMFVDGETCPRGGCPMGGDV